MASTYRKTLVELIVSKPSIGSHYSGDTMISDMESVELDRNTPLEIHFIWITVVLRFNLEGKSKGYENVSLAHLFMMNNAYYIIQKIKGSTELRELIGDYFVEKIIQRVQHEESNYLTSTWDRVLYPLEFKALQAGWRGLYPMEYKAIQVEWISTYFTEYTVRHSLLIFHAMFERAHETQAKWLVLDLQLREELHLSILKKLIPIYRSFMDQLHERYGKQFEKYIKYSVEDLETAVSDFFKGHPVSKQLRTSQSKWWKCGIIP
ncbi:exocyst complex component EXO70C1-like [Cornus florida]|uniref:exocyst complex component EXO70C1-like n=1 Tax=Cornus florida TaxID=4283 RepID=UPI0028A2A970|nr:exocyst complex component EXO70C1-like [Cornus florida]